VGDWESAQAAALALRFGHQRARALADVSQEAAAAGDLERAASAARAITDLKDKALALADVAQAAADAGDVERAQTLGHQAEQAT
jgi:hypothetical protein